MGIILKRRMLKFLKFVKDGNYQFTDNLHYQENKHYFKKNKNWVFDEENRKISSYKKYLLCEFEFLNEKNDIEQLTLDNFKFLKRKIDKNRKELDPLLYGFNKSVDNGTLSASLKKLIYFLEEKEIKLNENNNKEDEEEIKKIEKNEKINEMERETIIKSRIGQSKYRKSLINKYKRCLVCGISDEKFLIASHIKPWSESEANEKLDINNGLLLCVHHDALFDKNLISFTDTGDIVISDEVSKHTQQLLNINENTKLKLELNSNTKKYLKFHREKFLNK